MSRIKIYEDGYNEIVFKPTTNKVVIGINVASYHGAKYRSFNAKTKEQAEEIGKEYIDKNSRVKINQKGESL